MSGNTAVLNDSMDGSGSSKKLVTMIGIIVALLSVFAGGYGLSYFVSARCSASGCSAMYGPDCHGKCGLFGCEKVCP